MRCPKCYVETSNDALCCPGCKLPTPKGRTYLKNKNNRPQVKATAKRKSERTRRSVGPVASVLIVVFTVLVCGVGSYVLTTLLEDSQAQESDPVQMALGRLKLMPSPKAGLSVEQHLEQEVEKAREEGILVETEGWQIAPAEGTTYLISFSFEVKGSLQHRAEWLFDQSNESYIARTELAASVYKQ